MLLQFSSILLLLKIGFTHLTVFVKLYNISFNCGFCHGSLFVFLHWAWLCLQGTLVKGPFQTSVTIVSELVDLDSHRVCFKGFD